MAEMIRNGRETIEIPDDVRHYPIDFTRLFYMLYLDVDATIKHADTKAQLVMSTNVILLAASATLLPPDQIQRFFAGGLSSLQMFSLMLTFAALLFLVLSILFTLFVIVPRMVTTGNVFFFGYAAHTPQNQYIDQFFDMSMTEVKQAVMTQIHAKSVIAAKKLTHVKFSIIFVFLAVVLWLVSRLLFALG